MQLTQDNSDSQYVIRACTSSQITINQMTYHNSLILSKEQLIPNWSAQTIDDITADDLAMIIQLQPEIVLLGTGPTFKLPNPATLSPLYEQRIGVECMDTTAACRTYLALDAEGRRVVGAFLIPNLNP